MRRAFLLLSIFLIIVAFGAFAESDVPEKNVETLLLSAHVGLSIAAYDNWGDTTAAVLTGNGQNILCVAEMQGGEWKMTIDNPTALRQGDALPELNLDVDNALYWSYTTINELDSSQVEKTTYHSEETDGVWGCVTVTGDARRQNGSVSEVQITWEDGSLIETSTVYDENENPLLTGEPVHIPAEWLRDYVSLATFDENQFPAFTDDMYEWPDQNTMQKAALELMPAYTYEGATAEQDGLRFLMEKADGTLVFVGCIFDDRFGYALTESSPLPDGTRFGYENFSDSLYIGQRFIVHLSPLADGTWGLGYLLVENSSSSTESAEEAIFFGQNWVGDGTGFFVRRYIGDHPWSDVRTLDWNSLPATLEDAESAGDDSLWAVVDNPNPADQLHLRMAANSDAESLGKYYNGTLARVIKYSGDWTQVNIYGVIGWMMTKYLAIADDLAKVEPAFPTMSLENAADQNTLYDGVVDGEEIASLYNSSLLVIGVVGEEWYHVWLPETGLAGYIQQNLLTPGNG